MWGFKIKGLSVRYTLQNARYNIHIPLFGTLLELSIRGYKTAFWPILDVFGLFIVYGLALNN
jgi:hypothetical protein